MQWHYLPVWRDEGNDRRMYALCEVYLDDKGRITWWTDMCPRGAIGDSPADLCAELKLMRKDAKRWMPVEYDSIHEGMQPVPRLGKSKSKALRRFAKAQGATILDAPLASVEPCDTRGFMKPNPTSSIE